LRTDNPIFAILRAIFAPLTFFYGWGAAFRNYLYDKKYLESYSFQIPVISVGNLSVGGSGKTPMIDYLIRVLKPVRPGVISRGYGRKTRGFRLVQQGNNAAQVGDEPAMLINRHPQLAMGVGESRSMAIPELLSHRPEAGVILLDDAFQHRSVKPGLNILLTTHDNPFYRDRVLPWGGLREYRKGYKRADIILVTKCPQDLSQSKREELIEGINPGPYQKVYFCHEHQLTPIPAWDASLGAWQSQSESVALSGIANAETFERYINQISSRSLPRRFSDHHRYDRYDLESVRDMLEALDPKHRVVVTTEKDLMRLLEFRPWFEANKIKLWVARIELKFHHNDEQLLVKDLQDFLSFAAQ
jgi:tetraacyldisaccharide 4'-kinase